MRRSFSLCLSEADRLRHSLLDIFESGLVGKNTICCLFDNRHLNDNSSAIFQLADLLLSVRNLAPVGVDQCLFVLNLRVCSSDVSLVLSKALLDDPLCVKVVGLASKVLLFFASQTGDTLVDAAEAGLSIRDHALELVDLLASGFACLG